MEENCWVDCIYVWIKTCTFFFFFLFQLNPHYCNVRVLPEVIFTFYLLTELGYLPYVGGHIQKKRGGGKLLLIILSFAFFFNMTGLFNFVSNQNLVNFPICCLNGLFSMTNLSRKVKKKNNKLFSFKLFVVKAVGTFINFYEVFSFYFQVLVKMFYNRKNPTNNPSVSGLTHTHKKNEYRWIIFKWYL